MDNNMIIGGVVSFVVVAVILGAFIPVFATTAYDGDIVKTFENDDTFRMSAVGDDTIVFHYGDGVYTVNGVDYPKANQPIIQNDTVMFYGTTGSYAGYQYVITSDGYNRYHVTGTTDLTITFNGTDKTVSSVSVIGNNTYTSTYDYINEVYYRDNDGNYIWSGAKPEPAYVNSDWIRYNCFSDGDTAFYSIMGDVVTVNGVVVEATINTTLTPIVNYSDVFTIDNYSFTLSDNTTIDCRGYILPLEVVGHNDNLGKPVPTLISMLPLIASFGLVLGAVAYFLTRRV